ncbi:MAG: hypothetical protein GY926_06875 [bacterium]|nr:hypothetical protein [bacterium]
MKTRTSLTRQLPAGIVDASSASLATFLMGLAAVNLLEDADRGVYAIFFTTFMLATLVPHNLVFTPAEVDAVAYPVEHRIPLIRRTMALGIGPAALGALSVGLAALAGWALTTTSVIVPLTVTTAVAAVLSPLQDHLRKMLHIGDRSWLAAWVSGIQLTAAAAAILAMMAVDVAVPWIPFGALAIANTASLTFGWLVTTRLHGQVPAESEIRLGDLIKRGRWLVVQAAVPALAGFLAATTITRLASAEALGFAEAARVVSQPILVFATGLSVVLAPRTMEAAMNRDLTKARHASKVFLTAVAIAGIGYLAIAGWSWQLNPMSRIVPSAYEVSGLVALTIVANIANATVFLQINELLGAKREITLAKLSLFVSPIVLLGAATAGVTEAFARAIGRLGQSTTRFLVQRIVIRPLYQPTEADSSADTSPR